MKCWQKVSTAVSAAAVFVGVLDRPGQEVEWLAMAVLMLCCTSIVWTAARLVGDRIVSALAFQGGGHGDPPPAHHTSPEAGSVASLPHTRSVPHPR